MKLFIQSNIENSDNIDVAQALYDKVNYRKNTVRDNDDLVVSVIDNDTWIMKHDDVGNMFTVYDCIDGYLQESL